MRANLAVELLTESNDVLELVISRALIAYRPKTRSGSVRAFDWNWDETITGPWRKPLIRFILL
jgi:hypothetical protein